MHGQQQKTAYIRCGVVLPERPGERTVLRKFFQMCRKYGVRWGKAKEKEQAFIEEVTRVTYERDRALRFGTPLSDIRPSFAS